MTPQTSYGAQKAMGEFMVNDMSRKGFIDGRSVRVPTATVRPGTPNGAASGFASGIIREPLAGIDAVLPVPDATEMWVASPRAIVRMFLHALALSPAAWGWHRSINLPGFVVSMTEALETLRAVGGDAALAHVKRQPDAKVQKLVSTWAARFDTAELLIAVDGPRLEVTRGDGPVDLAFAAGPDFRRLLRGEREALLGCRRFSDRVPVEPEDLNHKFEARRVVVDDENRTGGCWSVHGSGSRVGKLPIGQCPRPAQMGGRLPRTLSKRRRPVNEKGPVGACARTLFLVHYYHPLPPTSCGDGRGP